MKIVFFNSHLQWVSHYETELELITNLSDEGHEIIQVYCNAQLPNCDLNPFMVPEKCDLCLAKHQHGLQLLKKPIRSIPLPALDNQQKSIIANIPKDISGMEELRNLTVGNFRLGFGIINSLIAISRDPSPSLDKYKPTLKNYIISSAGVYYSFLNLLKEEKPDRVYAFSGRFAHTAAVFTACKENGIDCYLHERGSSLDKYSVTINEAISDLDFNFRSVNESWEKADEKYRNEEGERFYNNRRVGVITNWYSFTKDHVKTLPLDWNNDKRNVLILHSSDDELAAIYQDEEKIIYHDQITGIKKIVESFLEDSNFHFYLRIHPNFKTVTSHHKTDLYELDYPNLTVITAESQISTYLIMDLSEKAISFGSSAGIEATFWGKPSILASNSYYKSLGSTYEPNSHEELCEMVRVHLEPMPKLGALKYGFYIQTFGMPFKHFKSIDVEKGLFMGEVLSDKPPILMRLLRKIITVSPRFEARIREKRILKSLSNYS